MREFSFWPVNFVHALVEKDRQSFAQLTCVKCVKYLKSVESGRCENTGTIIHDCKFKYSTRGEKTNKKTSL